MRDADDPTLTPALFHRIGEGARRAGEGGSLSPALSHPRGEGARRAGEGGSLSPALSRPTGEGARRAGEGNPAPGEGATKQRLLITAIATLLGAGVGLLVFGPSPAILLGVLVGFLTGQTIHGLVLPAPSDDDTSGTQAISGPPGHTTGDATQTPGDPPALVSGRDWSLDLVLGAWGLLILFVGGLAQWGVLGGEGASLVLIFVLPVLALLGLMGGSTASAVARRTLRQIEAGQRPEADRGPAQLALTLSRLTTVALVALLGWLLLRVNS